MSLAAMTLAGCNTIAGAGRDLTAAGDWLARDAESIMASDRAQAPVAARGQGAVSGTSQPAPLR